MADVRFFARLAGTILAETFRNDVINELCHRDVLRLRFPNTTSIPDRA